MGRYFGTNGIRGIPGRGFFTLDFVCGMASAIGRHMVGRHGTGPVLVGHDGRSTGPLLYNAILAALSHTGLDCVMAGMIPTPCLEYEAKARRCAGGIMITASHNPPQYNGMKAVAPNGIEISREDELHAEELYGAGPPAVARNRAWGSISRMQGPVQYIPGVASQVDRASISARGLRVVLDPGNGVQGPYAADLCKMLGCRYTMINDAIDGRFPGRGPEPTPENLSQLSSAVRRAGADLGVAFDGDGDRSIFCDENGSVIIGDRSALVLVRHVLQRNRGAGVATCLNSSSAAEKVSEALGSKVVRTKVGSVEVSQCMARTGALVGYEENGGFMYGRHNPVRDGCMTLALMLEALSRSEMTLSEHAKTLPPAYTAKTKVGCAARMVSSVMSRLREALDVSDDRDGLKVSLPGEGVRWVLVRPSGTEPALRIYAEAPTQNEADLIVGRYARMLLEMDGVFAYQDGTH